MNRRAFVKAIAGVAVAASVPFKAPTPARMVDPMTGISLRFHRDAFNLTTTRLDVLYGYATVVQPELACRITEG